MKIVAFAGTNSPASINKVLVEYVTKQFDSNDVELLDLNDYEMPIYGVHREQQSEFLRKQRISLKKLIVQT